jgi:hypothetical protein
MADVALLDKAVDAILDATASCRTFPNCRAAQGSDQGARNIAPGSAAYGELENQYFESCRTTVEKEAALGFDARLPFAGNFVMRAAGCLAQKHRFSSRKLAKRRRQVMVPTLPMR